MFLSIKKNNVTGYYFYPLGWFNFIYNKNTFDLKELTVKLVIQVYEEIQKDYDRKYRV